MAATDITLRFSYSTASNSDMRTFKVYQLVDAEASSNELELYRFYHPMTGLTTGVTTFHRKNMTTHVFETAGQLEWKSNSNVTVHFGIHEVPIRDLRKTKKSSSKSRRFKAGGSEYKWKIADNENDLFCVDSRGKIITTWSQDELILRVAAKVENILDQLVVTCLLNLWIRKLGRW